MIIGYILISIQEYILALFLFILGIIITTVLTTNGVQKFKNAYKRYLVFNYAKEIFSNLIYNANAGFSKEYLSQLDILNLYDRFSSNDYIKGTYKNINFESSDIKIEKRHVFINSDGIEKEDYKTIFIGRWLIFDFNKQLRYNLQIIENDFPINFIKLLTEKVSLESIEFNLNFNVYSEYSIDAYYILTPQLMERLNNIKIIICGELLVVFKDQKIHFIIKSKNDTFERSIFRKIDKIKDRDYVVNSFKAITEFIEELKISIHLFRKGE